MCVGWSYQLTANQVVMVGMEKKGYRMGWLTLDKVKGKTVTNQFSQPMSRTEPRRQTPHQKLSASQFPKTMGRSFDGFFGGTFGTSSRFPSSINDWLTVNGYPKHYGIPTLDAQGSLLVRTKSVLWGMEGGSTAYESNSDFNEARFGLTLAKASYIETISSTVVFSVTMGWAWEKINFNGVPLPYDRNKTGDFQLKTFSYYLSPSIKLFKPVLTRFLVPDKKGTLKSSWATGIDVGMRIYLWRDHWAYNDNNGGSFPGIESMPQIPQMSFYVNIPIGWTWEFFKK